MSSAWWRERLASPWREGAAAAAWTVLLAALFWTPRILYDPLRHWDEAWYAEMSRELAESNDPWTIHWNGDLWFHKPPLYFWATVGAYRILGVNEPAARLFSYLCGLATLSLIAWVIGRRAGFAWGLVGGMLLLAIPDFSLYATRGQMDVPVAFMLSAQLLTFVKGFDRPGWHWLGGIFFGLNLMTKGVAAGLALIVQGATMLLVRDARPLGQPAWWGGLILGTALAVPWHWQQWQTHGDLFLKDYFNRHFTQFFTDIYPESDSPGAPAGYYIDYLVRKRGIWGGPILLVAAAGTLLLGRYRRDRLYVLAWCWLILLPAILSCAWAKWSWYLVPIYPAAAILGVEILRGWPWPRPWEKWVPIAAVALAVASGTALAVGPGWKEFESEIRELGPTIAQTVPMEARVLTLQTDVGRRSIYPVSTCFYGRRRVQAVMSRAELSRRVREAGTPLFALVHRSYLPEIEAAGREPAMQAPAVLEPAAQVPAVLEPAAQVPTGDVCAYEFEEVASAGEVVLIRLVPGWLGQQLRRSVQAALKSEESR